MNDNIKRKINNYFIISFFCPGIIKMPIKFSFLFNSFIKGNNLTFSSIIAKIKSLGCIRGINYLLIVIFSIKTLFNRGNWGMISQVLVLNKE